MFWQLSDASRMTDCPIMWLSAEASLRGKEIIIFKFNLFLSNICTGALPGKERALGVRKYLYNLLKKVLEEFKTRR